MLIFAFGKKNLIFRTHPQRNFITEVTLSQIHTVWTVNEVPGNFSVFLCFLRIEPQKRYLFKLTDLYKV